MIVDNNKRPREKPPTINTDLPQSTEQKKQKTSGLSQAALEQIQNYVRKIEGDDSFLTHHLQYLRTQRMPSRYLKKTETGLPYSIQLFLDNADNINISVLGKKLISKESFKVIREVHTLNLVDNNIQDCVKASPKFISIDDADRLNKEMANEFKALSLLKGTRGIIKLVTCGVYKRKDNTCEKITLILERGRYDLITGIRKGMRITPSMLLDLAYAVNAIHEMGYAHGDIKEENVVVCEDSLRIIDFQSFQSAKKATRFGTPICLSPGKNRFHEIFCNLKIKNQINFKEWQEENDLESIVGQANDIYGLGLIFYTCVTKSRVPWDKYLREISEKDQFNLEKHAEICRHNIYVTQVGYKSLVEDVWPQERRNPLQQLIVEMLNPDDFTRIKSIDVVDRLKKNFRL